MHYMMILIFIVLLTVTGCGDQENKPAENARVVQAPQINTVNSQTFSKMNFDDFWLDKNSLLDKKVQLSGFGTYSNDSLLMSKQFGAANFIDIDTAELDRENKRHLLQVCNPYCNVTVYGTVEKNKFGILIKASRVNAEK